MSIVDRLIDRINERLIAFTREQEAKANVEAASRPPQPRTRCMIVIDPLPDWVLRQPEPPAAAVDTPPPPKSKFSVMRGNLDLALCAWSGPLVDWLRKRAD